MQPRNHCSSQKGIPKMKLQASRPISPKTLQSQPSAQTKNRLAISRLGILHGRLLKPEAHTLLFVLSVAAILPLAALLSRATESVAAKTGDTIGGLLNATLGNLTELVIALAALRAGQYVLVKASIAGAIVTNALFMLCVSFLVGGVRHHMQEYNRSNARLQAGLLFLATVAILIPSVPGDTDTAAEA